MEREITMQYRIGKSPNMRAKHNRDTWKILEMKLAVVGSAEFEQLILWCKDHDHGAGGRGFINYCIHNGWLVQSE